MIVMSEETTTTQTSDAVLDAEQSVNTPTPATFLEEYRGYSVFTRLGHKKGRMLWLSDQLTNGSKRPVDFDSLEQTHSQIDVHIQAKADAKAYAALRLVLESKIRQMFIDQLVWDVDDMLTALDLEKGNYTLFYRVLSDSGIRVHHPSDDTICLWTKDAEQKTVLLKRAARLEVGTYNSARTSILPNSRKKPVLTGEKAESTPISHNRFKTVRNSTILVTVGEKWKHASGCA